MVQSHLDGAPAPDRLGDYRRDLWPGFFAQLGTIAKDVHAVRRTHFGPVAGLGHATWTEAMPASDVLLAFSADPQLPGPDGQTLMDLSLHYGHDLAVQLLQQHTSRRGGSGS
ncbi:hypothetical protein AB0C70_26690 [Streptomyces sp. NPDC048564]|uniref:hypothetical protein n=1 Tax=Streptomyces sp. NPDC048564 TaxID=3155760 RepID=UPI003434AECD